MVQINSKLPNAGVTIFTVMSVLAAEHKAINLGQGFPDYPMDEELVDLVAKAMKDGYNQYVHMNGYIPLREGISAKVEKLYRKKINADAEITVTPGGTYALYTALTTILQPQDEVIIFEPAYDSYLPAIELNGAVAVPIQLQLPLYNIPWDEVREKTSSKTRAIIINSPHNPSGSVISKEDIQQLKSIVEGTNIIIISDEVYEHLIFEGKSHESILKDDTLFSRSFVCFSFGKVYNCTGWKLGYCIAPEALMKEFRKVHQFNSFTCDTPKQVAIASFIQKEREYLKLGAELQEKRDLFRSLMKKSRFVPLPSFGSYFEIYSYRDISEEKERDFAIRLTKEAGVATIPVSAFYSREVNNNVLRFCFAKKRETLEAAAERLVKL